MMNSLWEVKPCECINVQEGKRMVTREEGQQFAREHGCLFVETSAKEDIAVTQAFEELVQQIMQTPTILEEEGGVSLNMAGKGA